MNRESETKATDERPISSLISELKSSITGEVRFTEGDRALYATDASNYRQEPIGVVLHKTEEGIIETVCICNEYELSVLPRGGGTSLAVQCYKEAVLL